MLLKEIQVPYKSSVVCFDHFLPSDYSTLTSYGTPTSKRQLKKGAIPSIFPWKRKVSSSDRSERLKKRLKTKFDIELPAKDNEDDEVVNQWPTEIGREEYVNSEIVQVQENECVFTAVPLQRDLGTQIPPCPSLSVDNFMHDDPGILFYTGLENYKDFKFVLATLGGAVYHLNYLYNRVDQLSIENQFFFLTLIKLRRHKTNFELSRLFCISEHSVTNIWITWVNFMAHQWRELDIWPQRDVVRFFSPSDFRRKFPTTRVVVDGTEIPIQKPKKPIAQQASFSTYKNRNTVKVLVGCSSEGLVSYLSSAYGGSASDRQIVERSNQDTLCDRGDSIMADKGFNVQDIF